MPHRYAELGRLAGCLWLAGLLFGAIPAAAASPAPDPDFRTLGVGEAAADITTEGYDSFFCGSNGGAPLAAIRGWTDYKLCAPDADGLHEVDVQFGTKLERMNQMLTEQYDEQSWTQKFGGTRVANFPVVMSLLFDDSGISRGFRAVTSSKASEDDRSRAYLLRYRIYALYGDDGWKCDERPPSQGRTPVGKEYLDETCTKDLPGKRVRVVAHVFRRPGETGVDSTGQFIPGQFESMTRWEVWDAALPTTASEKVN